MIFKLGKKTYCTMQLKSNPDIKRGYVLKKGNWEKLYEGDIEGLKKWIKHQKGLAGIREFRECFATISGTSCRAACEDMGIPQI